MLAVGLLSGAVVIIGTIHGSFWYLPVRYSVYVREPGSYRSAGPLEAKIAKSAFNHVWRRSIVGWWESWFALWEAYREPYGRLMGDLWELYGILTGGFGEPYGRLMHKLRNLA